MIKNAWCLFFLEHMSTITADFTKNGVSFSILFPRIKPIPLQYQVFPRFIWNESDR